MRISELSRATAVPVPTIKYYLREGLLHPGAATGANQAAYAQEHVHRLRLIRTLREVGGLAIADVRRVLDAVDDASLPLHRALGVAHHALAQPEPEAPDPDVEEARADVDAFLAGLGWEVSPEAPGRRVLADALVALRRLGGDWGAEVFAPYAESADAIASWEIRETPPGGATRAELVEWAVVGTVVFDTALRALRWLAQEHHSAIRSKRRRPRRRRP